MTLFKKSRLINEILFIGVILYILILTVQSLRIVGASNLLPNKITIFEILKNYFFAISLLMIIEYFISFDLPNNYILSRVFGVFVMSTMTLVIFNIYSKTWVFNNIIAINIVYFISIIAGSIATYFIQGIKLNRSLLIGIANYIVIATLFVVLTFISPLGYIFEI
ncbi:MAG: hypothetical protein WC006_00310 [Bacilli bacterium]